MNVDARDDTELFKKFQDEANKLKKSIVDKTKLIADRNMWVVVNIGCIECGISSNIVGVFSEKLKAEELAILCKKNHSWRHRGQNNFEVFQLPDAEVINAEYISESL